ncbi:MAG: hypothetical protein FJ304_13130 [Planctomycetes bacterium]|nr:hypothetical protein [Planctomycetota bacterium]
MLRLIAFACLVALLVGCGKKTANDSASDSNTPPDGVNPPGGPQQPRAQGTGGGTAKVLADGLARIRLHNGAGRIVFSGSDTDGHVGAVYTMHQSGSDKSTELMDVYRVRTGEKVASIPITEPLTHAALSPGGKYVAGGTPFKGNLLRVLAANGSEVGRMSPAAVGTDGRPDWKTEVQYYTFLSDDRLLTVNCSGGYDIWGVPGLKRVGGRPGLNLEGDQALFRMSDNYPNLSALSADGKTIALYNWTGVSLIDVATGAEKLRTEAIMKKGEQKPQILRVALSPDSKRIVVLVIPSEGHADKCRVQQYDAADGKLLKETGFARDPATRVGEPGVWMWGNDHLVLGRPGFKSYSVLHLPSGNITNPLDVVVSQPGNVQRIDAPTHAGRLWFVGSGGGPDHPGYLFGAAPSALGPNAHTKKQLAITVKLGADG